LYAVDYPNDDIAAALDEVVEKAASAPMDFDPVAHE
jgi:hypothetical protein